MKTLYGKTNWAGLLRSGLLGLALLADGPSRAAQSDGSPWLDAAWQTVEQLTNDAKDQARYQEKVLLAMIEAGQVDRALERAPAIKDWRKLSLYSEAAAWLATHGRTNEARHYEREVTYLAPGLEGWTYDRIMMKLARARALLGDLEAVQESCLTYNKQKEFKGACIVNTALALARQNKIEEAVTKIRQLDTDDYYDISTARAEGYRLLAAVGALPQPLLTNVLQNAWADAARVGTSLRFELQLEAADAALALGATNSAREWLGIASSNILAISEPVYLRAPLCSEAALRWARMKEPERVEAMGQEALQACAKLELFERPAVMARVAEARMLAGHEEAARKLFSEAMAMASGLINLRPRCMAIVDVYLSMARSGLVDALAEAVPVQGAVRP